MFREVNCEKTFLLTLLKSLEKFHSFPVLLKSLKQNCAELSCPIEKMLYKPQGAVLSYWNGWKKNWMELYCPPEMLWIKLCWAVLSYRKKKIKKKGAELSCRLNYAKKIIDLFCPKRRKYITLNCPVLLRKLYKFICRAVLLCWFFVIETIRSCPVLPKVFMKNSVGCCPALSCPTG